jgi:hypothetical protein
MSLLIYEDLVDILKKHLDECDIKAEIKSCIGRSWHRYRNIRVYPNDIDDSIFYRYANGFWELHFENPDDNVIDMTRRKVMEHIPSNGHMNWHRGYCRQRGYLGIDEIIEDKEEFISLFDELWSATSQLLSNESETTSESDEKKELQQNLQMSLAKPNTWLDRLNTISISCTQTEYKKPETMVSSIGDLPFERFVIPPYQRPYKWGVNSVNQLINDIITFSESGTSEYRLGTLVLHQQGQELYIVDGQQRTITLILLLSELRKTFKDLFNDIDLDKFLDKEQFHESTSRFHLRENMNAIRFRLTEFTEKHVQFLLKNCKFVIITLFDISEAFQFFDSQNSRGKELEPHDLLKAFHLREIPSLTKADINNVQKWVKIDTPVLASLFLVLFRIKSWAAGQDGREFTSKRIDTFKGPRNNKRQLPYQKIYALAECYTELYNADISRRIDHQHMDYPHQIDQVTINGSLFFDMIQHYYRKSAIMKDCLKNVCSDIANAINSYQERHRIGDKYIQELFFAALLFYHDKFGEEGLSFVIPKIFIWAYSLRLQRTAVQLASVDNLAREENGFFRVLHRAISPADFQNWILEPIKKPENEKMKEIVAIFEQYKYIKQ